MRERPGGGVVGVRCFCFQRLLPPTSTSVLARSWLRGEAQLDGEFCFLRLLPPTSGMARRGRRGARSWTRSLFSSLTRRGVCILSSSFGVAHCFGLGSEVMVKGHMDKEFVSLRLSPPTSDRRRLGWKDCCCRWLWRVLPAISRMLCSVAVSGVRLSAIPDPCRRKNRHRKKWLYLRRFSPGRLRGLTI